jgi:hypothetical protein
MIATSIFTVILLLATFALIQIGKIYSKGVNSAATQSTARSIVDQVSQAIQFSGSAVNSPAQDATTKRYYFAAGSKCYSYAPGKQLDDTPTGTDQSTNAFVRKDSDTCIPPDAVDWIASPTNKFTELLGPSMRVTNFYICTPGDTSCAAPTPADSNLYSIGIRLIYGDKDLICSPSISSGAGSCTSNDPIDDTDLATKTDLICKTGTGSQFCAISQISTTVQKRI